MSGKLVQVSIRGDKQWIRALTRNEDRIAAAVGIELERQADATVTYIRENQAALFTNPTGNLAQSLMKHPYERKGTKISVKAGWGVGYGRVLEYGPRNKGPKPILPGKGIVASGPRQGLPTIALRWVTPGGVTYRRKSTYVWKESMKRPHWKKAVDATAGKRRGALRRAVKTAILKVSRG